MLLPVALTRCPPLLTSLKLLLTPGLLFLTYGVGGRLPFNAFSAAPPLTRVEPWWRSAKGAQLLFLPMAEEP